MKQRLILVGSGQHCNVVIYNIKCQDKYDIACICDMNPENAGKTIAGYPIEYWKNDSIECMRAIENKYDTNLFFIAFGNMKTRKSVFEFCIANGWKSVNIIHPNAVVSSSAKLGKGILIEAGCPLLCITPKTSEVARMVQKYDNGKCFDVNEVEQVVEFITLLASDKKQQKRMSDNSLNAASEFTFENAKMYLR